MAGASLMSFPPAAPLNARRGVGTRRKPRRAALRQRRFPNAPAASPISVTARDQ